jgi:ParB family chromosome partitioning protein
LLAAADDLRSSRAWQALEESKEVWRARLPERPGEWFKWLADLPQGELAELLALCAALTLNAMPDQSGTHELEPIAAAVGLDMADWWEPTAEGYLSHVSKAQIVQALKEAGVDPTDASVADMKKDALVTKAASGLARKRWLPAMLRPRPAEEH